MRYEPCMRRGVPVRVLVVDDDESIVSLMRLALEDEGYEVRTASNGRDGLALAAAFAPDVILLDMNMPVMDGQAFAAAYREAPQPPPRAPIIVVTAAGDAAGRAQQLRAAGFLGKPFDLDELGARVAAAMRRDT